MDWATTTPAVRKLGLGERAAGDAPDRPHARGDQCRPGSLGVGLRSVPPLDGYWRSTASYRVRIALDLKAIPHRHASHDLREGAQRAPGFLRPPPGNGAALEAAGHCFVQSPVILEGLEERYPSVPPLPGDPEACATVRGMAAVVACDIHPINNLRVLAALRRDFGASDAQLLGWVGQWISQGFDVLVILVARHGRGFCFGGTPTLADCCLVPQMYSAERHSMDLSAYPNLLAAADRARALEQFARAHPDRQADAPA